MYMYIYINDICLSLYIIHKQRHIYIYIRSRRRFWQKAWRLLHSARCLPSPYPLSSYSKMSIHPSLVSRMEEPTPSPRRTVGLFQGR